MMSLIHADDSRRLTIFLLIFCIFTGWTHASEPGDWGYESDNGPETWGSTYPKCSKGKSQSPINIVAKEASRKSSLSPLHLEDYDDDLKDFILRNDDFTVRMMSNSSKGNIAGGCMGDKNKYKFFEVHFHWGKDDDQGSEHQLNGHKFPLEVHILHYNAKYSKEEAVNKDDGLGVLGVFYKVTKSENKKISPIINAVKKIEKLHDKMTVTGNMELKYMLPLDRTFYYCYQGSLTTPGCSESVTWTVFGKPSEISEEQLEVLRGLKTKRGTPLVNNYRPVQPLNQRTVYVKGHSSAIGPAVFLIFGLTLISRMT